MAALKSPFQASTDTRLRIAGPFVLFLIGMTFFRLEMYMKLPDDQWPSQVSIALAAGFIGWEITRFAALAIQNRLKGLRRMRSRLFYLVIVLILISNFGFAIRYIGHLLADNKPWAWPSLLDYSGTMGVVIFYTTVILSIYEGGYIWKQWKQSITEKEKLIETQWQTRYNLLKTQINPHFLFNSLNSLSSLIIENPQQAEKFADEMSNVYRYLLRNNDVDLVTLSSEMKFIRSYCNLLTTRYGEGFRLVIDVPDIACTHLLPSLTLQLLVENAVKHNIVSKDQPLEVKIKLCDNDTLCIENNMQKKSITVHSNGVGLSNINSKFMLMNKKGLYIEKTPERFRVFVPLIPPTT